MKKVMSFLLALELIVVVTFGFFWNKGLFYTRHILAVIALVQLIYMVYLAFESKYSLNVTFEKKVSDTTPYPDFETSYVEQEPVYNEEKTELDALNEEWQRKYNELAACDPTERKTQVLEDELDEIEAKLKKLQMAEEKKKLQLAKEEEQRKALEEKQRTEFTKRLEERLKNKPQ